MALPLLVLAAKAGALAKTAGPVLAEWNRLPPDAKARVQSEASDVTRTLNELRRALGARLFASEEREITWDEARALALDPRPEFEMAKTLVERVRSAGAVDEAELRSGFAGGHHSGFEQALAIASEDGYIEPIGGGRWRITDFADLQLVESDEVAFIEQAIVEHLQTVGLASRDELALGVGAPEFRSVPFISAVERALAAGAIEWLGPGLYGLPRDELARRVAPPQTEPAEPADGRRNKGILRELAREIAVLRAAVARERAGRRTAAAGPALALPAQERGALPAANPSGPEDPIDLLRRLKELADAGVLTPEEFARKKAEILAQV